MIYILKQSIEDKNRQGISIDDFYYRDLKEKLNGKAGTGIRLLAYNFIKEGKILDRFLILSNFGDVLEITTIFKSKDTLYEFLNHPLMSEAMTIFDEKNWNFTSSIFPANDYLSLRNM